MVKSLSYNIGIVEYDETERLAFLLSVNKKNLKGADEIITKNAELFEEKTNLRKENEALLSRLKEVEKNNQNFQSAINMLKEKFKNKAADLETLSVELETEKQKMQEVVRMYQDLLVENTDIMRQNSELACIKKIFNE